MAACPQRYAYKGLDASEFRLLRLVRNNPSSPIECILSTHTLVNPPSYDALSYFCGDQHKRKNIILNGTEFSVTINLHEALEQLQTYTTDLLWVDAICIHQWNNAERSQQLKLMSQIYGKARRAILWLASCSDEDRFAIECIRAWSSASTETILREFDLFVRASPQLFKSNTWLAMTRFLRRPVWTRIWVFQEFVLSRDVTLLCGDDELPANCLARAASTWIRLSENGSKLQIPNEQFAELQRLCDTAPCSYLFHRQAYHGNGSAWTISKRGPFDIIKLQLYLHYTKATDPRDKIFALLGVIEDEAFIEPDYDKSIEQVYIDLTSKHILSKQTLEAIAHSGVGVKSNADKPLNLPSWVPDMRDSTPWPTILAGSILVKAMGSFGGLDINPEDNSLHTYGLCCDLVTQVWMDETEFPLLAWANAVRNIKVPHPTGIPQVQALFRMVTAFMLPQRDEVVVTRSDQGTRIFYDQAYGFIALLSTLELDTMLEDENHAKTWRDFRSSAERQSDIPCRFHFWFTGGMPIPKGASNQDLLTPFTGSPGSAKYFAFPEHYFHTTFDHESLGMCFLSTSHYQTHHRKFFLTEKGYIGFGPQYMLADDQLCILFGSEVPFIIRKVDNGYHIVGQCYVYGLIDGDLLDQVNIRDVGANVEKFCFR